MTTPENFAVKDNLESFAQYEDAVENYVPKAKGEGLAWPENIKLGAMGLSGEAGEFTDLVKKIAYHGHNPDQTKMLFELGDILWYLAYSAKAVGITLQEVAEANIRKLSARYPQGFDQEMSRNRVG